MRAGKANIWCNNEDGRGRITDPNWTTSSEWVSTSFYAALMTHRRGQNVTKSVAPLYFLWSTLLRLRDSHFRCTHDTFPCVLPATKSTCVPACASSLLSRSRIARRLSRELHTNCGTKVPLGNGLSRNADLGTASGTGPTRGHSLVSFGLELRGAFDLRQLPRGATAV